MKYPRLLYDMKVEDHHARLVQSSPMMYMVGIVYKGEKANGVYTMNLMMGVSILAKCVRYLYAKYTYDLFEKDQGWRFVRPRIYEEALA